jgi:hypothetical protein
VNLFASIPKNIFIGIVKETRAHPILRTLLFTKRLTSFIRSSLGANSPLLTRRGTLSGKDIPPVAQEECGKGMAEIIGRHRVAYP